MQQATKEDIPSLINILAPAFADNRSVNRCVKQDSKRMERIENQIRYISNISLRNEMAFVNKDKTTAMLSNLSYGSKATLSDDLYFITKVSGVGLGLQLLKREKLLKAMNPTYDFCHLWFIGVVPELQGQGLGTETLNFLKAQCEQKGLPIHLETSNPRNIKFYENNGFTLQEKKRLPMDNFDLYFYAWQP